MNTSKIGYQEKLSQNHGMVYRHGNREFGAQQQQPWQMGSSEIKGGLQQQGYGHVNSSNTIMDRIGSPATAFYTTEKYLGLSRYDEHDDDHHQASNGNNHPCSSQLSKNNFDQEIPSYQQSRDSFYTDSLEQVEPDFQSKRAMEKPLFPGSEYSSPYEKSYKIRCCNLLERERILELKRKLLDDFDTSDRWQLIPCDGNQDLSVSQNSYCSQYAHLRPSPRPSGSVSAHCTNSAVVMPSKTRIRWTQDLHDRFVECVNCLGGAEKATPKAILKLMDSEGLTIFHVKSHLQKYRIAKYIPDSAEGKSEKRATVNNVVQLDNKTGMQIKDALQMQLDVQRQLHQQLEIQRNLQMRIEEQGRQLKKMFDQQQKTNKTRSDTQNSDNAYPDEESTSLENVQIFNVEDSENTLFPSKIS